MIEYGLPFTRKLTPTLHHRAREFSKVGYFYGVISARVPANEPKHFACADFCTARSSAVGCWGQMTGEQVTRDRCVGPGNVTQPADALYFALPFFTPSPQPTVSGCRTQAVCNGPSTSAAQSTTVHDVLLHPQLRHIARRQHLRSAGCHQLFVPRHRRSMFGRRACSVAGPAACNSLPD